MLKKKEREKLMDIIQLWLPDNLHCLEFLNLLRRTTHTSIDYRYLKNLLCLSTWSFIYWQNFWRVKNHQFLPSPLSHRDFNDFPRTPTNLRNNPVTSKARVIPSTSTHLFPYNSWSSEKEHQWTKCPVSKLKFSTVSQYFSYLPSLQ